MLEITILKGWYDMKKILSMLTAVGNFYILDDHIPYVQAMRELASETDTFVK